MMRRLKTGKIGLLAKVLRWYVSEQSAVLASMSLTPLGGSGLQVFALMKGVNYISFFFFLFSFSYFVSLF